MYKVGKMYSARCRFSFTQIKIAGSDKNQPAGHFEGAAQEQTRTDMLTQFAMKG